LSADYEFRAPLWRWQGESPWHFVTLPEEQSDEIDERTRDVQRGFGSIRVEVTVGTTVWATSLFPSTSHGAYLLPVKKAVRVAEGLTADKPVDVRLRLLDLPGGAPVPRG
jgi:hypothetical protein